ncbi:ANTAR domain-containing protein [Modestobacter sp. URMC 112]
MTTSTAARTSAAHRPLPAPAQRTAAAPAAGGATARYRYDLRSDQWWWSPEVFALHGVAPRSAAPGAALLLEAVHPDDRERVRRALADGCTTATPFAVEHRVRRPDADVRTVVLVGEPELAPDGTVTALSGLLVDVTDGRLAAPTPAAEQLRALETEVEQLRTAMASRAAIEQAKGILMLLMGCGDQVAFDLLAHISSHTHRKVRDVAQAIIDSASGGTPLPADVRAILHDACPPGAARG